MTDGMDVLRRLTRPPPGPTAPVPGLRATASGTGDRGAEPEPERCEMCGEPVAAEHSHLADLEQRGLRCVCRGCYLLFTNPGAGRGRYRAVPERYRYDPAAGFTAEQWETLQIPVDMAFFLVTSALDGVVAFYPSPAGATESQLPIETWREVTETNPLAAGLEPDVEAMLVRRQAGGYECYAVPVDVCYELVGRLRLVWRGFDGGEEAHTELARFFARLRERAGYSAAGGNGDAP